MSAPQDWVGCKVQQPCAWLLLPPPPPCPLHGMAPCRPPTSSHSSGVKLRSDFGFFASVMMPPFLLWRSFSTTSAHMPASATVPEVVRTRTLLLREEARYCLVSTPSISLSLASSTRSQPSLPWPACSVLQTSHHGGRNYSMLAWLLCRMVHMMVCAISGNCCRNGMHIHMCAAAQGQVASAAGSRMAHGAGCQLLQHVLVGCRLCMSASNDVCTHTHHVDAPSLAGQAGRAFPGAKLVNGHHLYQQGVCRHASMFA